MSGFANSADSANADDWLDGREQARGLKVSPKELREMIEDDGFEVFPVSRRRWRIKRGVYEEWEAKRLERGVAEAEQRRRRFDFVAGTSTGAAPSSRREFRL